MDELIIKALKENSGRLSLSQLTTAVCGKAFGPDHTRNQKKIQKEVKDMEAAGRVTYFRGGGSARYQGSVTLID